MKRILSLTGILALAIVFTSAISINEMPQDPPKGKKHVKIVKVKDGEKVEVDTILTSREVFVFDGDTIGGKGMKWFSKKDFDHDFDFDFDIDVETDEKGNVFVFKTDGDSTKKIQVKAMNIGGDIEDIMKWHGKSGHKMFFDAPHCSGTPKIIRVDKKAGNVIDLSDPGIISFEKKDLKDGKEKITIVREKPSESEKEINEEIIIQSSGSAPMFLHEGPHKASKIRVMAGDDGKIEILEDGKVWSIDEMEEGTKVIERDGKKIIIKKIKEGDEMNLDVEVEEEK